MYISSNKKRKFRKNSKKKSSYASNRIEGNPLSFEQADDAIESKNRHFLKPEQEIKNYYLALEMLEKKLEKKEELSLKLLLEVQKQMQEITDLRRSQVGTGDRSERIRTYNFPQGRITDHRINYSIFNVDTFLDGDLEEIIQELQKADQKQKLENLSLK